MEVQNNIQTNIQSGTSNKKETIFLVLLLLTSLTLFGGIGLIERRLGIRMPEIFVERPFTPANIIVNVDREFGSLPLIWEALAQGGEEPGKRMLQPTVGLVKKIKPQYIRLDHIFDDDYYQLVQGRNRDGSLNLNWSQLDATVDDILASGAKPFFSLSYMPSQVASSKIEPPSNWRDWQDLVKQTVSHYSSKIDGVYYEVWNEPSLNHFGGWKMYGKKDYRQLYYYAVQGANQAGGVKSFKIGGPAIPEMDPRWVELLFDYTIENNLRLDFISWHRYSFDPDKFVEDVYEVNVLIDDPKYKQFEKIEKVVTEWGPNPEKDTVYSNQVAASHAVAVIRRMLDKLSWAFAFEIKDGPGQGKEGWGLLTHESVGIKEKPRYYLFDWLADLNGQRVEVLGEGSQIKGFAVKKNRTVTAILTNYDPYAPQKESFTFTFGHLNGRKYRLFRQQLFKTPQEETVETKTSSITFNLTMPPYSVYRVRLTELD